MSHRRVVVTGMGAVTPIGNSIPEFWEGLRSGKNGIAPISSFDATEHRASLAGEVKAINFEDRIESRDLRHLDRFAAFALYAAAEAVEQAQLMEDDIDYENVGVLTGSGIGGVKTFSDQHERLNSSPRRVSPFFIPAMIADIIAGHISIKYGFKGPNYGLISACATTNHTLGDAYRMLQYGDADVVVAGGSEASVVPIAIAGFANMKALSKSEDPDTGSRPFDLNRDGFVLGEGSGFLVLEELEHALNRQIPILGEIVGYGATGDAYHLTAPTPGGEGGARAMIRAIKDAGIESSDIDYVNAHGTSTPYNDVNETIALKTVFGEYAANLKISSTKSMTGHLLGAAGAVEALACLLAIKYETIPPTINYRTPDPECDLDYVPNHAESTQITYAMSNTFGFGGHNAVLIMKKWDS